MEKTKGYWWPISRPRDIYSWLYHVLSHVIPLSSCHMLSYPMNYVPIPFPSDPILSHYVSIKSHQKFHSIPVNPMKSHIISYIWVNYNISLTWINAIWGWFPLSTMIPVRSQWGRYNLPIYIYIHNFYNYCDIHMATPQGLRSPGRNPRPGAATWSWKSLSQTNL